MSSIPDGNRLYKRLKILSDAFLSPPHKPPDYKSVIRTSTKHFKVFTEADASVLMLNNNEGNIVPVFSMGIPFSKIKDASLPSSLRLKDIIAHSALDVRYASFMNTPLIHNRKLIGVSAVFSTTPEKFYKFEHNKCENLFLTMLASYISVNIENITLINTINSAITSELDWENTFNTIDDLISIHDKNFNIIRANTAVARKFNTDIKEILGEKCYKVFHGTEEPWKTCPHKKVLESKINCTEEIEDPHMGGVFRIATFPHFNKEGRCIGTIHITRNITENKGC